MNGKNFICKEHSGIKEAVKTLKKNDADQWSAINSMKSKTTIMLTAVIITLIGVVANLIVALAR